MAFIITRIDVSRVNIQQLIHFQNRVRKTVSNNYIDNHIDEIRQEFKLLGHWIFLNAADQMIPGNYWLTAVREFYNFVEYGRI